MAPKPKKMTDAEKARLKELNAGKGFLANGKLSMDEVLERQGLKKKELRTKAYSPAPMSAAAKAKAGARGKATGAKTKPKSLASKVVKRAAVTAREARDVVTAAGSVAKGVQQNRQFYTGRTLKNLKNQVVETGRAAVTGKKGTESNQVKTFKTSPGQGVKSSMFTGYSRDKAKNKPGTSVAKVISDYEKMLKKKKK